MITSASREELDAAMAVVRGETMTDEKKNSTQQVGVGDNIRVIKQLEGYFVSLRDGRTGLWGRWARTEEQRLMDAYDATATEPPPPVEAKWPTWLERSQFQHSLDDDEREYEITSEFASLICEPFLMSNGEIEGRDGLLLKEHLAWRSRVAKALDMVEPGSLRDRASLADELVLQERECHAVCTAAGVPVAPRTGVGVYSLARRIEMVRDKAVAAELRWLADWFAGSAMTSRARTEYVTGSDDVYEHNFYAKRLRARADDLDPTGERS